jgi:hypothetical protein
MNRAFFGCTAPDSVMGSDLRGIGALAAALLASGLLACGSSSGGTSPRTTGIDGGDTGSAASGDSGSASAMDATTDSPDGSSTDAKPTDATVDATLPDATLPPPGDVGPAGFDASALQSAASALGPGQWFELPATNKLSDVFPTGMTGNWGSASGAANVVNAWGGGAVAEGALFVWGGGHNDYGGNEVYSFDLGSFTWSRVTNPSDYVTYPCGYSSPGGPCVTVDGTPVSAHSYEGINFIPTLGKVWVGGGAPYSTVGGFTAQSALFDQGARGWTLLPDMPYSGPVISAWDPVSQKLLIILGGGATPSGEFFTYNPASGKYENVSSPNWSVGSSGDFDTDTRKFVLYDTSKPSEAYVYDLSGANLVPDVAVAWSNFDYQATVMGGAAFAPSLKGGTGMVYCAARKLFVLWDGASSDVWTLDAATWSWSQVTAQNQGPAPGQSEGVYGRWRYLPAEGVFLAYDNLTQNPWIYRLP